MSIPKLQSYVLPNVQELPINKTDWQINPQKAVLLIHDMQQYFLDFWSEDCSLINILIEQIKQIRKHCKTLGIPVIYTAQPSEQAPADRGLLNDIWGAGLTRKPERAGIASAIAADAEDTVLTKWRYSAFYRSSLHEMMQQTQRDQLIITGVYAHIGCLTTALDAFMQNIKVFMVADALADFSREDHLMALKYVSRNCGQVIDSSDIFSVSTSI